MLFRNIIGEFAAERFRPTNLITGVFNDGFVPSAKLTNEGNYSIISDYLGTPVEAYDEQGQKVWSVALDIYGRVQEFTGEQTFIPFRYQGQYEDVEIGLYYNRFRYYDPAQGNYTQVDPIGLAGGNPTLYGYVGDTNNQLDPFGLKNFKTVDFTGHEDLFPHPNSIVIIKLTGDRDSDFTAAYKKAGIEKSTAKDNYTWHHVADFNPETGESTMQLIKRDIHEASLPHQGSVKQFLEHFDLKSGTYGTYESKMKAYEAGWRDKKPRKMKCKK